jgi:hypothetical protein
MNIFKLLTFLTEIAHGNRILACPTKREGWWRVIFEVQQLISYTLPSFFIPPFSTLLNLRDFVAVASNQF